MKKIFLTSGLVLCMASPAFATGFTSSQSGTITNACVEDYLGTESGTATLDAQWTAAYHEVTLNVNSANGAAANATVNPSTIYGITNDSSAVYTRSGTDDSDYVFTAVTNNTLTSTPAGKSVTLTLDGNKPDTAANDNNVSTLIAGAPNNTNRAFKGFYSEATDGTKYIEADGEVNSAGIGVANTTGGTWYAQYDCVTYQPEDPTLEGYTFAGWYDARTGGNQVTNFCLDDDTTLYAHWTRNSITIVWQGNGADSSWTSPAGGTESCDYGSSVTLPTQPTRTGYTFNGWAVASSGTSGGNGGLENGDNNQNAIGG